MSSSVLLLVLCCLALLAASGQNQECDVGGECVGTLLGFASTATTAECLVQCKGTTLFDVQEVYGLLLHR